MAKSSLKKDRYDILIDLIQHGIDKHGGFRESFFAGRHDGVYNLDFYKKVEQKPKNTDSDNETKNPR